MRVRHATALVAAAAAAAEQGSKQIKDNHIYRHSNQLARCSHLKRSIHAVASALECLHKAAAAYEMLSTKRRDAADATAAAAGYISEKAS